MSSWTSPATWGNTTLTATQMNTEVRDHCIYLKGALDLITEATTADTGTATYLGITRDISSAAYLVGKVYGDSEYRFWVGGGVDLATTSKPGLALGSGSSPADTNLYRDSANVLKTDDTFAVAGLTELHKDGHIVLTERADPSAPSADGGYLYIRDNGAGKTQLVIIFNTGAVQVIATQP